MFCAGGVKSQNATRLRSLRILAPRFLRGVFFIHLARKPGASSLIKEVWWSRKAANLRDRQGGAETVSADSGGRPQLRHIEGYWIGFPKSRALKSDPGVLVGEPPFAENSSPSRNLLAHTTDRLTHRGQKRRRFREPDTTRRSLTEMRAPRNHSHPAGAVAGRASNRPRKLKTKNREHASQRSLFTGTRKNTNNSPAHADKTNKEGSGKLRDICARGTTMRIPLKSGAFRVESLALWARE